MIYTVLMLACTQLLHMCVHCTLVCMSAKCEAASTSPSKVTAAGLNEERGPELEVNVTTVATTSSADPIHDQGPKQGTTSRPLPLSHQSGCQTAQ